MFSWDSPTSSVCDTGTAGKDTSSTYTYIHSYSIHTFNLIRTVHIDSYIHTYIHTYIVAYLLTCIHPCPLCMYVCMYV